MRKVISWLLAVVLLFMTAAAGAETVYTMAGFDGDNSNHDWTTNLFFARMKDMSGIGFEFEQVNDFAQWQSIKAAYLAGTRDVPDVLFKAELSTKETLQLLEAGKIIDLKPYLEEYAPNLTALLKANPEWEKAITLPGGQIAALPQINQLQSNNAMWINRQWLDNLGLEVPTTAEELTAVLRAFRAGDPNGNGKTDEVPLTFLTMWDLKFLGHAFGLIGNDYNVYADENGQVQTTLTAGENRTFLTWLHQLWEERLIDRHGFSSADSVRAITDKEAVIPYGVMLAPTPLSVVPAAALSQFDLLMPLTWEGKQIYRDFTGDLIRGTFAIGASCKNPAEMVAWVDYLYSEEGSRLAQAGLEDVEYEWHEDGTWSWIADAQTVATTVLAQSTIAEGGMMPGLSSVEFQRAYDEKETSRAISALLELKEVSVEPYPLVWLDDEQLAELAAIQADLGSYAEQTMVWFVTGDLPLDDENWNTFCDTLQEKGLARMLEILQDAIK